MVKWIRKLKWFFWDHLHLHEDTDEVENIISSIYKGVFFKGTNLWILIFAIFIASIGLNVNSTAVIIGAMLISPLMGPIIGFGFGLGIYDFLLVKKSLRNLFVAVLISLITSTIYFLITPFQGAQSELLARTQPNTYDVLIALFGGLAGIIAATRKEKTNVVPGVAIATALMPPLCTVGYGIANGEWRMAAGAFYLFFINSVFISLTSLIMVRFLDFPRKENLSPVIKGRTKSIIALITLITFIPSIYFAYTSLAKTAYKKNAMEFIQKEMVFENGQILDSKINPEKKIIELVYVGQKIDSIQLLKHLSKLKNYNLNTTRCFVKQVAISNPNQREEIKNSILEDLKNNSGQNISLEQRMAELENTVKNQLVSNSLTENNLLLEFKRLVPEIENVSITKNRSTSSSNLDSISFITFYSTRNFSSNEKNLVNALLVQKFGNQRFEITFENTKISTPQKTK